MYKICLTNKLQGNQNVNQFLVLRNMVSKIDEKAEENNEELLSSEYVWNYILCSRVVVITVYSYLAK